MFLYIFVWENNKQQFLYTGIIKL